ncbi:methyl-accepting chemotaxis protein [Shewanella insulae]|uniref:methyl-accepting chemotaxis protein n=1 Tax=Shewanella insulae TaxID=2681496 RepID=UPI001EFCC1FA|nr:methyl-accepting chemotaxis protein [Shewanella insulae]MCG9712559.1 methyl-accepting chemotaxis protein [Shewanella insulae]MCG9738850.1 methyl-accepting chemotaxis protein [Shewanella insulae]MCG9754530.1 methyl-accepting chemotaxis protein [Shewanella insulae]
MKTFGFKKTITLAVIILVSLCLALSNLFSYLTLKRNTVEQVNSELQTQARFEAEGIQNWFTSKAASIDALAAQYRRGQLNGNFVMVARLVKENSLLYSVFWGFEDGSSYASVADDGIWHNGIADPSQYDPRPRGWYQLARNNDKAVLTDIYVDMVTGNPVISIVTDVGDGVLSGDIGLEILEDTVNSVDFPGASAAIIDEAGKVLASNMAELQAGKLMSQQGWGQLEQELVTQEAFSRAHRVGGRDLLLYSHAIPLLKGNKKWFLLLNIDQEVAFARVDEALDAALVNSAIILLITIVLVLFILHWLYRPILQLKQVILGLSRGQADLTMRLPVTSRDDLGEIAMGVNRFIAHLEGIVRELYGDSQSIGRSIVALQGQTDANSQVLNRHVQETEQIVAAVEEMSATANDVANNTSQGSQAAILVGTQIMDTKQLVANTRETVNRLIEDVEATELSIGNIAQDAASITKVLQVIGDIADQTNLLALNAAIEAARAGEQGRGFAVVADEVRALAARTQSSTAEIEQTLSQLLEGIDATVTTMQQTKGSCEQTSNWTHNVTANLDQVIQSVEAVSDLNTQIATAAEEQSMVSAEVSRNMAEIRDMVVVLEDSGSASRDETLKLSASNRKLMAVVDKFTLGEA